MAAGRLDFQSQDATPGGCKCFDGSARLATLAVNCGGEPPTFPFGTDVRFLSDFQDSWLVTGTNKLPTDSAEGFDPVRHSTYGPVLKSRFGRFRRHKILEN
jgi:hypothetical protein